MANLFPLLATALHLFLEVTADAAACTSSSGKCPTTTYRAAQLLQVKAARMVDVITDHPDKARGETADANTNGDKSAILADLDEAGRILDGGDVTDYQDKAMGETADAPASLVDVDEVDSRGCRKMITYTHLPMEGSTDIFAGNFPLKLQDVAIAMISGRDEFFNTTHETVLRYAPRGLLIKARGKCPCSFRAALKTLQAAHPRAKWYYVGDEDAIIDLSQLTQVLSKYDSSMPTLMACNGGHVICRDCGACPTILTQQGLPNTKAFYGGNGQILSAGLVKELEHSLDNGCLEALAPTLEGLGDLENTCAMARAWKPHFRFVQLQKSWAEFEAFQEGAPTFITAHHLCVENVNRMGHINSHFSPVRTGLAAVPNGQNDGCVVASETEQHQ